jgi:predicted transcriptional regulator
MKSVLMTLAGAALVAAPAYAQTTPAPAATSAAKAKPERMVCREDNETGSMLKKHRICMTASQWREQGHRQGMDLERTEAQRSGQSDSR